MKNICLTKLYRRVFYAITDDVFFPTERDCYELFKTINRSVFNYELTTPIFKIVNASDYWGLCTGSEDKVEDCEINIHYKFPNEKMFINTLAHEMVHQWEWLNNENMTHGPQFYQWRKELSKYNISLTKSYNEK